jgi:hypothetical protein
MLLLYNYIDDIFTKYFFKIENKLYVCNSTPSPPPTYPAGRNYSGFTPGTGCMFSHGQLTPSTETREVTNAYPRSISRRFLAHP